MIRAVLFDMDGTLFDTEGVYRCAWRAACRFVGHEERADEVIRVVTGRNNTDIERYFKEIFGEDFDYAPMREYKNRVIEEIIRRDGLRLKPGVPEVFDVLHERGILCAVASSTSPYRVEWFLSESGIDKKSDLILSGGCVEHSKPAPDVFLLAAEKLGVAPDECLVAEDSENGVLAGYAAGMRVVFVKDLMDLSPKAEAAVWRAPKTLEALPDLIDSINNS